MKDALCKAFCDNLRVRSVPAGFAVSTVFLGPDGDRIGFYVRREERGLYRLEDDGTTLPMLEASGLDFGSGSRAEAMRALLGEYGVSIDKGGREFFMNRVKEDALPATAMRFVAFSLRVRDFALMTEARVLSTFRDDVRKLLGETLAGRARVEERAAVTPKLTDFLADFVLHSDNRPPVGVFLGMSDARVLEAVLVQFRARYETQDNCAIIALLEQSRNITQSVRQQAMNRLTAVADFRGDEIAAVQRIAREALGFTETFH